MSTAAHDGRHLLPRPIPRRPMTKQEPNTVYPFCISGSRSAECHAEIAEESHEVRIIVHSQHVASPGGAQCPSWSLACRSIRSRGLSGHLEEVGVA